MNKFIVALGVRVYTLGVMFWKVVSFYTKYFAVWVVILGGGGVFFAEAFRGTGERAFRR